MATLREIKRRVNSVGNISQITSAMQMVAASKMRKAQEKTRQFMPYAQKIAELTLELSSSVDVKMHSLLSEGNPEGRRMLIIISTDKGLCGALNSNLFRQIIHWYKKLDNTDCVTIGKKGVGFIRNTNAKLIADFSGRGPESVISAVNSLIIEGYLQGEYSSVEVIFNRFVNSFNQVPTRWRILPIVQEEEGKQEERYDFKIEPSAGEVLDAILPQYIQNQIRDAALSAEASEYSARMVAMKNATDNAKSLVSELTLEYNKMRQREITMSIADMVTARLAVEQ